MELQEKNGLFFIQKRLDAFSNFFKDLSDEIEDIKEQLRRARARGGENGTRI